MNVKDYLKQGRLLDQRINYNLRRIKEMRDGLDGICSPQIKADKVQTSPDGDPAYVKILMRISEMEERIDQEIDMLVDLRNQIDETVKTVKDENYQMLLLYRYIENRTWENIGEQLGIDRSTVKRWHRAALELVVMPENPISMQSVW
ncbi:MAG: DUF1492 domain-containing protein [Lachnospiraceae bacterium]|nr:DUF1492 domain-containing protein [Lachnospiraceae bacterium]